MAISGVTRWLNGLTADAIIDAAMRKIGVYDSADSIPAAELTNVELTLNAMIKEWTSEGIGLWLRNQYWLILQPGRTRYRLGLVGSNGTDDDFHFFSTDRINMSWGTLSADAAAAADTLTLSDGWFDRDSIAQIATREPAENDTVVVRLDDGSIWADDLPAAPWTSPDLALTNTLPSAASSGNRVYVYTSQGDKPSRIVSVQREDSSGNAAALEAISRIEYENLSRKTAEGDPVRYHFDPRGNPASQQLFVWPVSNSSNLDRLNILAETPTDNIDDATTDNFQFPDEFGNALIWNLAHELCYDYGIEKDVRRELYAIAERKKASVLFGMDREQNSIMLTADLRPTR